MFGFKVLVFCILGSSFSHLQADIETNREVIQSFLRHHLSMKDYDSAETLVKEHLQTDSKDFERWNVLGFLYLRKQDYDKATRCFDMALKTADNSHKGEMLYTQAEAYNKNDRHRKAKESLQRALAYPETEPAAREALDLIEPGKDLPPLKAVRPGEWNWNAGASAGYDNNALLLSNNTLDSVSRSGTASPSFAVSTRGGFKKDMYSGKLDSGANLSYNFYSNAAVRSFNTLSGAVNGKWTPDFEDITHPVSFNGRAGITYLNPDIFNFFTWNSEVSAETAWTHSGTNQTKLEIPFRYQNYSVPSDRSNDRTGVAAGFKALHQYKLTSSLLSFGLDFERAWTNGENFKSYQYSIPIGLVKPLPLWKMLGMLNMKGGQVFYTQSQTNRRDLNLAPTLMFIKGFDDGWTATLTYSYIRNESSVESASYEKHSVMLGFEKRIF